MSFGQSENPINKRPLTDFGDEVRRQVESKSIDLGAPFEIELLGKLGKDGKLDWTSARFTKAEGDKKIVALTKDAIEALNDSGYFQYLSGLLMTDVVVNLRQGESDFAVSISSELASESRSRTLASSLGTLLQAAIAQISKNQNRADDILILKSIVVSSDAKKLLISSKLPKTVVRDMVERAISRQQPSAPRS